MINLNSIKMISVINNKETVCFNIKQIIVRIVQLQLLQDRGVRYHCDIRLGDGNFKNWYSIDSRSFGYIIINPRLLVFKNEITILASRNFFNFTQVQAIPEESDEVLYNGFSKLSEKEFFRILI